MFFLIISACFSAVEPKISQAQEITTMFSENNYQKPMIYHQESNEIAKEKTEGEKEKTKRKRAKNDNNGGIMIKAPDKNIPKEPGFFDFSANNRDRDSTALLFDDNRYFQSYNKENEKSRIKINKKKKNTDLEVEKKMRGKDSKIINQKKNNEVIKDYGNEKKLIFVKFPQNVVNKIKRKQNEKIIMVDEDTQDSHFQRKHGFIKIVNAEKPNLETNYSYFLVLICVVVALILISFVCIRYFKKEFSKTTVETTDLVNFLTQMAQMLKNNKIVYCNDSKFPLITFILKRKEKTDDFEPKDAKKIGKIANMHFKLNPLDEICVNMLYSDQIPKISNFVRHPLFLSDEENAFLFFDKLFQMHQKFIMLSHSFYDKDFVDKKDIIEASKNALLDLEPTPEVLCSLFERDESFRIIEIVDNVPKNSVAKAIKYYSSKARHEFQTYEHPQLYKSIVVRYPRLYPYLYLWYAKYLSLYESG